MQLDSSELARFLHHYEGIKEMGFKRKMTNGYQEMSLVELQHEIDTGRLIMVFKKKK